MMDMVFEDDRVNSSQDSHTLVVSDVGVVGLAVMGQNLALNIAEKGFKVSVYNRSSPKTKDTIARAQEELVDAKGNLRGFRDIENFVRSLKRPRRIILMVKAGNPVDATIAMLQSYLEPGDLIIDGGNEWYENTQRRAEVLSCSKGILYMGMGVSGGEEGARHGPSLMPGGSKESWDLVKDILRKIAAQVEDGPCVTYIGPGGSGNYVKMVHNGIEYADMQLIGEVYDLLRHFSLHSFSDQQSIPKIFEKWNKGELESFLIEITANILRIREEDAFIVDKILDQSGSKGTGMWTIQEGAKRGVPISIIAAALDARYVSSYKELRVSLSHQLQGCTTKNDLVSSLGWNDFQNLVHDLERALLAAKICCYAQGMALIQKASDDENWNLDCGEIARIWKGGCIIRARFLDRIKEAYRRQLSLSLLLSDEQFVKDLNNCQDSLRRVVSGASILGIPVPAMASALSYYDSLRREILSSSQLIQAQRDYFGAHTYQRLDKDGVFHSRWLEDGQSVLQDS
eukprot:jgi/Galph1/6039/GphlegSOOS_G4751.1